MNYLVTGYAGFIGRNLTRRLLAEGHNVTGVDNFITGSIDPEIEMHEKFTRNECDIKDFYYKTVEEYQYIINLACPASPVAYQNAPFQTMSASTEGVLNLLKAAKYHKAIFLHTSTSEVYGDPEIHPQTEEYWGHVNCFGPRACYDEGKRMGETIIWEFMKKNPEVETRIIRIFNTYGPFMALNDGRVVSNFIVQALKGEPITIYGDGRQTRSFCYIDDLLDALFRVLHGAYNMPVNTGNPGEYSMLELATAVLAMTGSNSEIVFKPLPHDDPKQRCPDISKMIKFYDWYPKVKLGSGLEKTIPWFRDQLQKQG